MIFLLLVFFVPVISAAGTNGQQRRLRTLARMGPMLGRRVGGSQHDIDRRRELRRRLYISLLSAHHRKHDEVTLH